MDRADEPHPPGTLPRAFKTLFAKNGKELSAIRGNFLSAAHGQPPRAILLTSSADQEGKTTASISLAFGLSTIAHARVLLVDGNAAAPKLHEIFNLDPYPGLSDAMGTDICGKGLCSSLYRQTEYANLKVLPFGKSAANYLNVFGSETFSTCLENFKREFDLVIMDGTSFFISSDTSVMARFFDGVVVVIRCESTKREVVRLVQQRIESVGGRVLGAVLNRRKYYIPNQFYKWC